MIRSLPIILRRIILVLVAGAGTDGFGAGPEPPGFDSDDQVQLGVRAAIGKDPALKSLNLWVSVRDGVALVNGGVPDEITSGRIEALLSRVPGVKIVRITTWSVPSEDPIRKLVADRMSGPSVPSTGASPPPQLAVTPIAPGVPLKQVPHLPELSQLSTRTESRPEGTVVVQRVEPPVAGGLLQPPVVGVYESNSSSQGPAAAPYPTIRPTLLPVAPADSAASHPAETLLLLRQSDPRFSGLTAVLQDGTATISGTVSARADADAFAAAVAKLPGVNRVTVAQVRIR